MTEVTCSECFHYGKSLVTSKTECVLAGKHKVNPDDANKCDYFVKWVRADGFKNWRGKK